MIAEAILWLSRALMVLGVIFIAFGVFGLYRFKNFYPRILIGSKIDTVGYLTLLLGLALKSGWNMSTLKILLIILLMLVINPILTHTVARSAYLSGLRVRR